MIDFYTKLTRARIAEGMAKETALAKVPANYRAAVRAAIDKE